MGGGSFVLNCTLSDSYSAFDSMFPSLHVERSGLGAAWRTWAASPGPGPRPPSPSPPSAQREDAAAGGHRRSPALDAESRCLTDQRKRFSPVNSPLWHARAHQRQVKTGPGAADVPSSSVFLSAASIGNADTLKNKRGNKINHPTYASSHTSYSQQRNAFPVIFICFWTLMQTM